MSSRTFWRLIFWYALVVLWAKPLAAQGPEFPQRAQEIVNQLYQRNVALAEGDDDQRRALTRMMIEQIVCEFGTDYGGKSADPTRPFSKDSIALKTGGKLYSWDWQNGSTRRPQIPPFRYDISDQTFIPVGCVQHLNQPAPGTPMPPAPSPAPTPAIDLGPVLQRLDQILGLTQQDLTRSEQTFEQLQRQHVDLAAQVAAHDDEPSWLRKHWRGITELLGGSLAVWLTTRAQQDQ